MKRIIILILCSIIVNSMNAQIFDKAKQLFNEATSSESSVRTLAKERFIERYEMTTEREARLYGINWYRKPSVIISNNGKMTGKKIIELCNHIVKDYPHVNLYKIAVMLQIIKTQMPVHYFVVLGHLSYLTKPTNI